MTSKKIICSILAFTLSFTGLMRTDIIKASDYIVNECAIEEDSDTVVNESVIEEDNDIVVSEYVIKEDNETYHVEVIDNNGLRIVIAENKETNDQIRITLNDEAIKVQYAEYEGVDCGTNELYDYSTSYIEREDTEDVQEVNANGYGSKKTTIGSNSSGNKYWYQMGNGNDSAYIKIGCVATYKVKISKDSTNVTNYTSSVNAAAAAYNKAAIQVAAGALLDGVALASQLLSLGLATPIAASMIASALGFTAASASNIVEFNQQINNAAVYYDIIKAKGTKL